MLNVFHCVLDLNDGAAIYGRQVRRIRLRKAFEVFEESRVLREDTPMNAKLRVLRGPGKLGQGNSGKSRSNGPQTPYVFRVAGPQTP
jgi:hypothetical protein